MPTIAFLFDGDNYPLQDFDLACHSIFAEVLDSSRRSKMDLRAGAVLLSSLSYRTRAIESRLRSGRTTIGSKLHDDSALRATLAVAFSNSVATMPHAIATDSLSVKLLTSRIECMTASDLPLKCSEAVHSALNTKCGGYLGYFEVDKGNPLLLTLAANGLIPFCSYDHGILHWIVPDDLPKEERRPPVWTEALEFDGIEFTSERPDYLPNELLSPMGLKIKNLLENRGQQRHAEKVLNTLYTGLDKNPNAKEFSVAFGEPEFGDPRADVSKLRQYCLNEQHPTGKDKAQLFRKLLSITADNWYLLAEQLVSGLQQEMITRPSKTEWGVQYQVKVPVTGPNGVTMLVTSGWIIRPNESPYLTSAYIESNARVENTSSLASLIVLWDSGPGRWESIYNNAHAHALAAAESWTPTPMWVQGFDKPETEGVCGFAWVTLTDGKSSFSRWLKRSKIASQFSSKCVVYAETGSQSLERARRYTEAFAQALRLNGVACQVDWRYD